MLLGVHAKLEEKMLKCLLLILSQNLNIVERKTYLGKSITGQISRQNAPLCEAEEEEEVSTILLEVEEPELAGGASWC
jgi:hypothetical protein